MATGRERDKRPDRDLIVVLACMLGSVLVSGYVAARLVETSNGTDPARYERFYASLDR